MNETYTLFCNENDQAEVRSLAIEVFKSDTLLKPIRNGLRIELEGSMLTLNFLYFRRRADKFSTTRGSAYFHFKSLEASSPQLKQQVLDDLLKCNLIVGVVAKPALDFDQRFVDLVFRMAINFNGYVFNGTQLFDSVGQLVLPN